MQLATNKERPFYHEIRSGQLCLLAEAVCKKPQTKQCTTPSCRSRWTKGWGCRPCGCPVLTPRVSCQSSCPPYVCHESGEWAITHQSCNGVWERLVNSPPGPGYTDILPKCGLHCPADQSAFFLAVISGDFGILLPPPWVAFPLVHEHLSILFNCSQR